MPEYKTPVVYIQEATKVFPAISDVESAIPAFIGYTEKAVSDLDGDLRLKPQRIGSILEYERYFGLAFPETSLSVDFASTDPSKVEVTAKSDPAAASKFKMYHSIKLFFLNGGRRCLVVSVGNYRDTGGEILIADLESGLNETAKADEVTLILFPDGLNLSRACDYYLLHSKALVQCAFLKDRFVVMDVWISGDPSVNDVQVLRDFDFGDIGIMRYGAVYYPRIFTQLQPRFKDDSSVAVTGVGAATTLAELESVDPSLYLLAKSALDGIEVLLPASTGVVGQYVSVDGAHGVWKAPANVAIKHAVKPEVVLTDDMQADLNVDVATGKSVNAIRSLPGRGSAVIWGIRTLAGNDSEWRYVPVCRFFIMAGESIKIALGSFVSEPNVPITWALVRTVVESYLTKHWRMGAFSGATPKEAFYVRVGLGETMTSQDVEEGRMILEVGMALIRPSEFIILRLAQGMSG